MELTHEQRSRADDLYADCCREDDVLLNAAYELIGLRDRHADTRIGSPNVGWRHWCLIHEHQIMQAVEAMDLQSA